MSMGAVGLKEVLAVMVIIMFIPPMCALLSVAYRDWKELKEEQERWKK